jgi:GntR family transcriptional repressor for pyruvate dehydrogenase complex
MNRVMFKPIETSNIYMRVIDQIMTLIRNGSLKRGDQLPPETQLVVQFGVSRASVREALKALEVLGILESRTGVGSFVKETTPSDAVFSLLHELAEEGGPLEIMEARKAIEPQIAFLAALRRTADDLEAMKQVLILMEQQVAKAELTMEVDMEFHMLLATACGNPVLADCMQLISSRMGSRFWQIMKADSLNVPGRPAVYLGHHRKILKAIDEQNASRAEAAMLEHLEAVEGGLEE